jgi:hypothetical protein
VPQARDQFSDLLQMQGAVWRHERIGGAALKALEDENAKLKKLLAEAMLDLSVLKDVASKKW